MAARGHAITVDELLALNDELRALAKAGVPLEPGLRALGKDLPGRLGRLTEAISTRLERGESLIGVVQDPALNLPRSYSAVVAAGVRSGRLPAALESLSLTVRRTIDLRHTLIAAAVYPLLVMLIASLIFVFTWNYLFPRIRVLIPSLLEEELPAWFGWLTWSVDHGGVWLLVVWSCVAVLGATWWIQSRGAAYFGASRWRWTVFNTITTASRSATFAETMALLIEHEVPLTEALQLSGAASGDCRVGDAADELARRIESGSTTGPVPVGLPPLLSWLILTRAPSGQIVKSLRQTAAALRDRAVQASIFLGVYLPILVSAGVGAVVGLYYALLVMAPFYFLLWQLSQA